MGKWENGKYQKHHAHINRPILATDTHGKYSINQVTQVVNNICRTLCHKWRIIKSIIKFSIGESKIKAVLNMW